MVRAGRDPGCPAGRLRPAGDTRSGPSRKLLLGEGLRADVGEQVLEGVEAEHRALEAGRADLDPQQVEQVHGLDAGCGLGENALFLAARGHRVTGIDFVEEAIRAR